MRNKMKKVIMILLICSMAAIVLSACGNGTNVINGNKKHVVLLVSGTANEADFNIAIIEDKMKEVCETCGTLSIIQIDGAPYLVDSLNIPERKEGLSDTKVEQIVKEQCMQIVAILEQCRPKTEEMDTLAALQMAARELEGCKGEKELIIINSGISTTGLVDFTKILLEKDQSEKLLSNLKDKQAVPDFTDVQIIWAGLGETAEPQETLYEKNRKNLKADWEAVLTASGAEDITFLSDLSVEKKNKDIQLPNVSVVPIVKPIDIWTEADVEISIEKESEAIFKYDESKISFQANTAELLTDQQTIEELFKNLIIHLKEDASFKVLLAGTTASPGTSESLKQLSMKRAERIKEILVSADIPSTQIQIVGLGYNNNFTIKDTDENGNLIESKAKQNRAVFVMNAASDTARQILN